MAPMTISRFFYSSKAFVVPVGVKTFNRKLVLKNVSTATAYNTITDIEKYKEYIPYCFDSKVIKKSIKTEDPEQGTLHVEFQKYRIDFMSDVSCLQEDNLKECRAHITEDHDASVRLFEYLNTVWKVRPISIETTDKISPLNSFGAFKGLKPIQVNNFSQDHRQTKNGCEVELVLSFKFKSRLLQSVSLLFGEATMTIIMNAFAKRMITLTALDKKNKNLSN